MAVTGERELLQSLSAEAERRMKVIIDGIEALPRGEVAAPESIESLRAEAHALKGAAAVTGQERLAELASLIDKRLADQIAGGTIGSDLAAAIVAGARAVTEGARAAASGSAEPPSVADSIAELTR